MTTKKATSSAWKCRKCGMVEWYFDPRPTYLTHVSRALGDERPGDKWEACEGDLFRLEPQPEAPDFGPPKKGDDPKQRRWSW